MRSAWEEELEGEGGVALPRNATSPALANAIVVKSGPGRLYGFTVYNSKVSAQFILVFDLASLPLDGATADIVFTVATVANLTRDWRGGRTMQRGIVLCNSSTEPTKTIGAADCFFDVQYV